MKIEGLDVREVQLRGNRAGVHLEGRVHGAVRFDVQRSTPWRADWGTSALRGPSIDEGRPEGGVLAVTGERGCIVLEAAAPGLREIGLWGLPDSLAALTAAAPALASSSDHAKLTDGTRPGSARNRGAETVRI